jgi:SulP family sulfate permease
MWKTLRLYLTPWDGRYEDLRKGSLPLNLLRDVTAGLVVAMIAIPLAMGFAMASGLRPEQGIVGGAVAGLVGALFGGSKYQVYGPTAAFIPIIGAIMQKHDHGFLVLASLFAGAILILMGLARIGRVVALVPHSIVVGFTIGIAFTIAFSQAGEVLGLGIKLPYGFVDKVEQIAANIDHFKVWALVLALATFFATKWLLKVSAYIPAPLIALGVGLILGQTALSGEGLTIIRSEYGSIPAQSVAWTPPSLEHLTFEKLGDLIYYAVAIVFVAAIESLLCSRMADRLANNTGQPFNPNKELWGQGLVMVFVPMLNGFPHTGALARTATNIKLGAVSPLAGIFKFAFKLLLAFYIASYLELVPVACMGGILLYVAMNMVKPSEIGEVVEMGRGHTWLMVYTAAAVILWGFLVGVLTALAIFGVWRFIASTRVAKHHEEVAHPKGTLHDPTVRAVLAGERRSSRAKRRLSTEQRTWLSKIRQRPSVSPSAFVHHKASLIGRVILEEDVHIAASASVRADEGSPFFIGAGSNIQDGVVIHALKDRWVKVGDAEWAVYVGRRVSVAHDALVHGPCFIGDDSFVGFKAVVHDAVVGSGCFIGIGAVVVGVEVPDGRFVPNGLIVDSQSKVASLPPASEAHQEFNRDVVEVNRGLAAAYTQHATGASHHTHSAPRARRVPREAGWGRSTPNQPSNARF